MTLQDLGNIGEFVGAVGVIATLAYLAVQVRQNTRALRASTFQDISMAMSRSSEAMAANPDLVSLVVRGAEGLADLTPEDRHRYNLTLMMVFRRLESVYVQRTLGSVAEELTGGFERSSISSIASGGGAEWWETARPAFNASFVAYVDEKLTSGSLPVIHPAIDGRK